MRLILTKRFRIAQQPDVQKAKPIQRLLSPTVQPTPAEIKEKELKIFKTKIENQIAKDGYVTINVDNLYYFTIGLGSNGRNDLFSFAKCPYSMFQIIADRYCRENWIPETNYTVSEFKVPALLLEPSRVKLRVFGEESVMRLKMFLTKISADFQVMGYTGVLLPDSNNTLHGEQGTQMTQSLDQILDDLIVALVKEETTV